MHTPNVCLLTNQCYKESNSAPKKVGNYTHVGRRWERSWANVVIRQTYKQIYREMIFALGAVGKDLEQTLSYAKHTNRFTVKWSARWAPLGQILSKRCHTPNIQTDLPWNDLRVGRRWQRGGSRWFAGCGKQTWTQVRMEWDVFSVWNTTRAHTHTHISYHIYIYI